MASGFSGGGSDFYGGMAGRSMAHMGAMGNNQTAGAGSYRTQIPGMFMDSTAQIVNQSATGFVGKRPLEDFHAQHQNHPSFNALFRRSVKPRMEQHALSVSPLSPMDFPTLARNFCSPASMSQRYGPSLLQQLRPQTVSLGGSMPTTQPNALTGLTYMNPSQIRVSPQDTEKKMMNQLQELEKQLLDDNDQEGDAVSVITNANSEWSETIQSLISSSPQSISPSSTSSTTSTSSFSPAVASPATSCSKQTLMEAASAISEGKMDVFYEISARLAQVANPKGNSEQRLIQYLTSALKSKVNPVKNQPVVAEYRATQSLYDLSMCFQLGFMAANRAILEATLDGQSNSYKFHVIDFDIGKGLQYKDLLYELSKRRNGKPAMVKITAVADNGGGERFRSIGEELSLLGERIGVSLKFKVVGCPKLSDLSRESLGCEPDETLAVNFAFTLYRMPDESVSTENPRDELLRRVKGLAPRVVTLVEQEMNTNTAPFVARVGEVTAYYAALLESIDSIVAREQSERAKVEEVVSRRIANSVACEGLDRIERCEVFGKWRARMGMAGFELKPLSQNVAESMQSGLSAGNRVNPGFTVKEEKGGICCGWMGRTLTVASAWR
ncbi:hypothetical protein SLE2022_372930 [Rubroshorea leprosula]